MSLLDPALYPFESRFFDRGGGIRMHYLDEGKGEPVVMLHGNPTWSFFYRDLIKALKPRFRVLAPDHVGMGLSDKPGEDRYAHTLKSRLDDLEAWLESLGLRENLTLVVHDWGGMIGMAYAARYPDRVSRLVVLNTAAFPLPPGKPLPLALGLCRTPGLGSILVRGLNGFARGASLFCSRRGLPRAVRAGFLHPYGRWRDRLAVLRFVEDIPLSPAHPSYGLVEGTDRRLGRLAEVPMLVCWGGRDFVFDADFLAGWKKRFPRAEVHEFPEAGHYILEDAGAQVVPLIAGFLDKHPL